MLTYLQQWFVLSWTKIEHGGITEESDNHRVAKKYHNVSLTVASTRGVVVLNML